MSSNINIFFFLITLHLSPSLSFIAFFQFSETMSEGENINVREMKNPKHGLSGEISDGKK